ncbi:AdoMet-dependent rRNA methyltransferase spb1 [Dimargaris cristalligena]|uniref:Spb1 C-terminal domain-containing protein n=1 Tax=Dimargaris cristalligena TaxID=215637 RepID=A0A4P9ZMN4_9FUNG|nr:AdoMet-dependent rRNA methyltransferase spb1 [Dimargaris cristalligena]RKP34493.1 Spb1 C-terminal domain-containing protein [Dimargaris cristalligena]|eukprot:RKP34493.1 Spb1 C-terminal domain-containing protein [Dimargaris cristalligena]
MGFKKQTGKGRLDKYYHLAKEQGYRARSAFKLIQLNKKFNFLSSARCVVDLCAAPGGWLQVAKKYMPASSVIIGIDLAAIRPIPGVVTFVSDITTEKCRTQLRAELKTWKVDVVLHDGAPNVGAAWVQDAYSQAELTLMSMKLAVEFLAKGGTFVTKVFRSKDYNNLMWVFNQLFSKVEATKPPSSRNVSAEIFVVCRGFLAPKKLDPKFVDPKYVFKDLDLTESTASKTNILKPEVHLRQRDGYEEGNYTLFKTLEAIDFVEANTPVDHLSRFNAIEFKSDASRKLLQLPEPPKDIVEVCADLKVLGKRDFNAIIKWRKAVRLLLDAQKKAEAAAAAGVGSQGEESDSSSSDDDEDELDALSKAEARRQKRLRRRTNEKRQRTVVRMQMSMTTPVELGQEEEAGKGTSRGLATGVGAPGSATLFNLRATEANAGLKRLRHGDMEAVDLDVLEAGSADEDVFADRVGLANSQFELGDEEGNSSDDNVDELEKQLDFQYREYQKRLLEKNAKLKVQQERLQEEEFRGIDDKDLPQYDSDSDAERIRAAKEYVPEDSDSDSSDSSADEASEDDSDDEVDDTSATTTTTKSTKRKGPLVVKANEDGQLVRGDASANLPANRLTKKAALWFNQSLFEGIDEDEDDDDEEEEGKDVEGQFSDIDNMSEYSDASVDSEGGDDEMEIVPQAQPESSDEEPTKNKNKRKAKAATESSKPAKKAKNQVTGDQSDEEVWDSNKVDDTSNRRSKDLDLVTPEALTLAHNLINQRMTKTDLLNQGFHRWAFNDTEGLPEWFVDDEQKHRVPNLPVTKEAVRIMREKMKALDARPIKKIAEAKARKKMKVAQRINKMQKTANAIADNEDMTEREKASTIHKVLNKQVKKEKKMPALVVARGSNRGLKGRPTGVKGRYKMVDRRMKKEMRATKRKEKSKGNKRK